MSTTTPEEFMRARQAQIDAISLTRIDQIPELPWGGNFWVDNPLFKKCDAFVRTLPTREERIQAEILVSWHGMGEEMEDDGSDPLDYLDD
jgi:hypothetical protein